MKTVKVGPDRENLFKKKDPFGGVKNTMAREHALQFETYYLSFLGVGVTETLSFTTK